MKPRNLLLAALVVLCARETNFAQSPDAVKLIWSFPTGGAIFSSPAIGPDGTIYVGSDDKKLYAVNPDGTTNWTFTTGAAVKSSPMVGRDGTIYVGSNDNKLYGVSTNGLTNWVYQAGNDIFSSPALGSDGTVYVGSLDGRVHAVDSQGFLLWYFDAKAPVYSSPAVAPDGTVYVGAGQNFYALNSTGTQKWVFTVSNTTFYASAAIADDGSVYVGAYTKKLYALTSAGTQIFASQTSGEIHASPSFGADGIAYVGSYDRKLYAVRTNSFQKWALRTGGNIQSSPAVAADGTIYVGSDDKNVYCFTEGGTTNWMFKTGAAVRSSPVLSSNGVVYVGSNDKKLYALQGTSFPIDSSWPMFRKNALHTGATESTNRSPVLNPLPNQSVAVGELLQLEVTAVDPDGNHLTYGLANAPATATINSTNGIFQWTPTDPGTSTVTVTVTDNGTPSMSDFRVVTVTVTATNAALLALPVSDMAVHADGLIASRLGFAQPGQFGIEVIGGLSAETTRSVALESANSGATLVSHNDSSRVSDATSPPITLVAAPGIDRAGLASAVNLTWNAISGRKYKVQYKTHLTDAVWSELSGEVIPSGTTAAKVDETFGWEQRFYRVVEQ